MEFITIREAHEQYDVSIKTIRRLIERITSDDSASGRKQLKPDPDEVRSRLRSRRTKEAQMDRPMSARAETLPLNRATVDRDAEPPAHRAPKQLGRYRIEKQLGSGGQGSVYAAFDEELQRRVALKMPNIAEDESPAMAERFQREARAAATLDHPNVCSVYDCGRIDGALYMTMAYVEGIPLSQLIRRQHPLPQRAVADLVRKLARAMQHAHDGGVVHRDLKPANIIVSGNREPVIVDFGLARHTTSQDTRLTIEGLIMGTPPYMAPEQARGAMADIGPVSDIYSLGAVLYEMLTGKLPFEGSVPEMLAKTREAQPPDPSQHRPDIDVELEAICLQALSKDVNGRFSSMSDLAEALEAYLRGSETSAESLDEQSVRQATDGEETPPSMSRATDLLEHLVLDFERHRQRSRWTKAGFTLAAVLLLALGIPALNGVSSSQEDRRGAEEQHASAAASPLTIVLVEVATVITPETRIYIAGVESPADRWSQPIALPPGEHQVVIKRGEEVVDEGRIQIRADEVARLAFPVQLDLDPEELAAAEVYLNGEQLPRDSWDNQFFLPLGEHNLVVRHPDVTVRQSVTVGPTHNHVVFTLPAAPTEPGAGGLVVESPEHSWFYVYDATGQEQRLEGELYTHQHYYSDQLKTHVLGAGTYVLKGRCWQKTIEIRPGEVTRVAPLGGLVVESPEHSSFYVYDATGQEQRLEGELYTHQHYFSDQLKTHALGAGTYVLKSRGMAFATVEITAGKITTITADLD